MKLPPNRHDELLELLGAVRDERITAVEFQRLEWKNYMLQTKGGAAGHFLIAGNDAHTLFGGFTPGQAWQYVIYRPLANTANHWKRIGRITTADMQLRALTVSIPHYFDAVNAAGKLDSFSPRTDGKADQYAKRPDLGQYTLEIEAPGGELENFLNVITMKGPGAPRPRVELIEGQGVSGVRVGNRFVVFANGPGSLPELSFPLPGGGPVEGLVLDLPPGKTAYVDASGGMVRISTTGARGRPVPVSAMGVTRITVSRQSKQLSKNNFVGRSSFRPSGLKSALRRRRGVDLGQVLQRSRNCRRGDDSRGWLGAARRILRSQGPSRSHAHHGPGSGRGQ